MISGGSFITCVLYLCLCEQLCSAAFYTYRQYGPNDGAYSTNNAPLRSTTLKKNTIPPNWVQLYKKLENQHGNTRRSNPWPTQITGGSGRVTPQNNIYPPQRDLRAALAGRFSSLQNSIINQPRKDLLLPRQPMMNYFYDKKQQRTPKQELIIARVSYPSLNAMIQGSNLPTLLQRYKNNHLLQQQTSRSQSTQSRSKLRKHSSIDGNIDKKSTITSPYNPAPSYYNMYQPIQTSWYPSYQQQYTRGFIPAAFVPLVNYKNQYSTRMNNNRQLVYGKSYFATPTSNIGSSVKKAFIPRNNVVALSQRKEKTPSTKTTIPKSSTEAVPSTPKNIHSTKTHNLSIKNQSASNAVNTLVGKGNTVNSTSVEPTVVRGNSPTGSTVPTAQNKSNTTTNLKATDGYAKLNNNNKETTITSSKFLPKKNFSASHGDGTSSKHQASSSDAHYTRGINRTHHKRHFYHRTRTTKSANKRGFLSSPEEFEDEVGEFPIEDSTAENTEQTDALNALDQDQSQPPQAIGETDEQPSAASSLQEEPIQQEYQDQQEETIARDQTSSLSPLENEDAVQPESQPDPQPEPEPEPELESEPRQTQQQQNTIPGAQEVPLLNIETPDQNGVPEFLKNEMNKVPEQKLSSEFGSQRQPSQTMMMSPSSTSSSQRNEPPSSDIAAGSTDIENAKNDIMNLQGKSKGSKANSMNSDEESEAQKEEKEANKLISNKEQETTPKIQDRPDIIGLGSNGMPSSVDKNAINMQTGNVASTPENGVGIDQAQSLMMDHLGDMDKIHEELRDDEGLETKSIMQKENNKPTATSSLDSSSDAEATIAKLQQHDDMLSDKFIKSLSSLKEPPDSVALGDDASQKLIRNMTEERGEEGVPFELHPSANYQEKEESLLDPVRAQERAEELKEKAEREKELQKAVERSDKETHSIALKTEDALNALDGKPLSKISIRGGNNPELKLATPEKIESDVEPTPNRVVASEKSTTEIKPEETKKPEAPLVTEKKETTKEKPISEENPKTVTNANQIQTPKENSTVNPINEKPAEVRLIKLPANDTQSKTKTEVLGAQKNKVVAENATVSIQVADVLKEIGQIKESAPKAVLAVNKTPDNEEKGTKEAVKDLNVFLGAQKDKVVAENAAVSNQVVDVLKGIGQIKESAPKAVLAVNKTLDNEEKETKEAVNDLNVAIGILEKKLSLINHAKSTGDTKKSIYLVDSDNKKQDTADVTAASRSKIELDNSLKLLEKVMNVAQRVGKQKQKPEVVAAPSSVQSEKRTTNPIQRTKIQRPILNNRQHQQPQELNYDVQQNANFFPSQQFIQNPSGGAEYRLGNAGDTFQLEEIEDEGNKRDTIYRYPVADSFIVPSKRNKIPSLNSPNNNKRQLISKRYYNNNNNNNWNFRKGTVQRPFYTNPYSSYNRQAYYQRPWSYPRY